MKPKTTLDHWFVLKTVVEQGGFHQAAEYMGRSQSALSYAIAKLQQQLGVPLMEMEGRKAKLTEIGQLLVQDGNAILGGMMNIEERALSLARGHELKVHISVENIISQQTIIAVLADFRTHFPDTLLEVEFASLSTIHERYEQRASDIYLLSESSFGSFSQELGPLPLLCVASAMHPLAVQDKAVTRKDLALSHAIKCKSNETAKDMAYARDTFSASYWTFNSFSMVIDVIKAGLGYGWVPEHMIQSELENQQLVPLNLAEGALRTHMIRLVHKNLHGAGPAALHLAKALQQKFSSET